MAQYAVLIYAGDSAHHPDATAGETAGETAAHGRHGQELMPDERALTANETERAFLTARLAGL